jgi:hypothetical protein
VAAAGVGDLDEPGAAGADLEVGVAHFSSFLLGTKIKSGGEVG